MVSPRRERRLIRRFQAPPDVSRDLAGAGEPIVEEHAGGAATVNHRLGVMYVDVEQLLTARLPVRWNWREASPLPAALKAQPARCVGTTEHGTSGLRDAPVVDAPIEGALQLHFDVRAPPIRPATLGLDGNDVPDLPARSGRINE
jgi:hypothetical protein